jgi:arylsulfatase A-like enzyme
MDPHGPYKCDKERFRELRKSPSLGKDRKLSSEEHEELGYLSDTRTPWLKNARARIHRSFWRACYAANVAVFDAQLVPLLRSLEAGPRSADTAVLFTSDHGEALLDHKANGLIQRGWEHGWNLHFHQTMVPMIVRLPDGVRGGSRVTAAVTGLDIAPTLLRLAGVSPPKSMQGRDMLSKRPASSSDQSGWVFSSGVKRRNKTVSVQNHRYKMIIDQDSGNLALYDRREDPGELSNIAGYKPSLVEQLRKMVAARAETLTALDLLPVLAGNVDPAIIEELRALGYLAE